MRKLGKVAIVICRDIFFPEYISALRAQGVELICHPTFRISRPCDTFSDNIFENERRKDLY